MARLDSGLFFKKRLIENVIPANIRWMNLEGKHFMRLIRFVFTVSSGFSIDLRLQRGD